MKPGRNAESYRNPVLSRLPEYVAGKPIGELAREKGLTRIVKLASNENALGASPKAHAAYESASKNLHLYPDNDCFELAEAVANRLGVSLEMLVFGTGSDDAMHLAAWAFGKPGSFALVPQPGFLGYPIFSESFGVLAKPIDLPNFEWNIDAFIEAAADEVGFIFLASPNSPTGTGLTHADVEKLLSSVPPGITVILDLAYEEFDPINDKPRFAELIEKHENLIACKTFSKAYGLAALRLGYAIARPQRIADMKRLRTPFAANSPALAAAVAALEDTEHLRRSIELAQTGVSWWTERLRALGCEVVPSRANFVMARIGREAKPVFNALLDRGVILRHLGAFGVPDALRITAGTPEENEIAFNALREVLA